MVIIAWAALVSAAVFALRRARSLAAEKQHFHELERSIIEAKKIARDQPQAFSSRPGETKSNQALKSGVIREAARSAFRITRMTETDRKDLGERQVSVVGVEVPHRSLVRMLAGCERARRTYVRSLELKPSSRMERAYEYAKVVLSRRMPEKGSRTP